MDENDTRIKFRAPKDASLEEIEEGGEDDKFSFRLGYFPPSRRGERKKQEEKRKTEEDIREEE